MLKFSAYRNKHTHYIQNIYKKLMAPINDSLLLKTTHTNFNVL
ncbi:hypothetical protein NLO413_0601 [Candidatus Neoehrlichia lotoris str. RAC413]|uniref:Uncharacterized protein n=1 Tax=Candidatus Neoehrlichia procyonis str. RAC413 TaxID=1359163 RepID=A0A0F3NMF4_9RICK|nr:hypothetical protein NLO413_0601 [Candidatus Neoehrlichia lotoris str. RAC413]